MAPLIKSKGLLYFLIYFINGYSVKQTASINVSVEREIVQYNRNSGSGSFTHTPDETWSSNRVPSETVSGSELVVFQTSDPNLLANNLVYVETKRGRLDVTMYNLDGTVKKFNIRVPGEDFEETEQEDYETEVTLEEIEFPSDVAESNGLKLEKDDKYLKYTFEHGVKCLSVHYDGKEVWSHKQDEAFPVLMIFSIKGSRMLVKFEEALKIFRLYNDKWEFFYSGNPKSEVLDISKRSSNGVFTYLCTGKLHSFTAKVNHIFSSVVLKAGLLGSDEKIWKTDNFPDYANIVVCDKTDAGNLVVTIYHLSGLIRTFKKQTGGNWGEYEIKCSETDLKQEHIVILTEEEKESPENDELQQSTTLESPASESQPAEVEEQKASMNTEVASETESEEAVSPNLPDRGTELFGKTQGDATPSEPEHSSALKDTKAPYVEESDIQEVQYGTKPAGDVVTGEGGRAGISSTLSTIPARKIPVHLDIETKRNTVQFEYSESGGLFTYEAKEEYYFRSVKNGTTEIWAGSSIDSSASKVIAAFDSSSSLVGLTLHLVNREVKRFQCSNGTLDEVAYANPMGPSPAPVDSTTDSSKPSGVSRETSPD